MQPQQGTASGLEGLAGDRPPQRNTQAVRVLGKGRQIKARRAEGVPFSGGLGGPRIRMQEPLNPLNGNTCFSQGRGAGGEGREGVCSVVWRFRASLAGQLLLPSSVNHSAFPF